MIAQAQQERLSFIHSQGSSEDHEYDQVSYSFPLLLLLLLVLLLLPLLFLLLLLLLLLVLHLLLLQAKICAGAFAAATSPAREAFRVGFWPPGWSHPSSPLSAQSDPPCWPTVGGCLGGE